MRHYPQKAGIPTIKVTIRLPTGELEHAIGLQNEDLLPVVAGILDRILPDCELVYMHGPAIRFERSGALGPELRQGEIQTALMGCARAIAEGQRVFILTCSDKFGRVRYRLAPQQRRGPFMWFFARLAQLSRPSV